MELKGILLSREGELLSQHRVRGSVNDYERIGLEVAGHMLEDYS
ncbi:hypothetical protein GCM10025861_11160 [Methanobacterium petrolearium]|nr:hypothetical protein GCM10025861_11160 [Methanobacterium petrolearium]